MKKSDSYLDRNLFNEEICDLVEEYLSNKDAYTDEVVAIQKKTKKIKFLSERELNQNWEVYPINKFLRRNVDDTSFELDIDATLDLADSYFFFH
jgi:hypothetical protein